MFDETNELVHFPHFPLLPNREKRKSINTQKINGFNSRSSGKNELFNFFYLFLSKLLTIAVKNLKVLKCVMYLEKGLIDVLIFIEHALF